MKKMSQAVALAWSVKVLVRLIYIQQPDAFNSDAWMLIFRDLITYQGERFSLNTLESLVFPIARHYMTDGIVRNGVYKMPSVMSGSKVAKKYL